MKPWHDPGAIVPRGRRRLRVSQHVQRLDAPGDAAGRAAAARHTTYWPREAEALLP